MTYTVPRTNGPAGLDAHCFTCHRPLLCTHRGRPPDRRTPVASVGSRLCMPKPQALKPRRRLGRPPGSRTRPPPAAHVLLSLDALTCRIDTAAKILGCGRSSVKKLIISGEVESIKITSMRLIKLSSLRRLVGETVATSIQS